MSVGLSYKRHKPEGRYDAIVIGSGIGGLTTASLLARAGQRVLVLERHYTAGGFTHTFTRPGRDGEAPWEWDVGVHYLGEVNRPGTLTQRLFDTISDGALQWADLGEVYDRIVIDGDEYDFPAGPEPFRTRMHAYFPREQRAIDQYMALIQSTARRAQPYFAERILPGALASTLGAALRKPLLSRNRSTAAVLSELTDNERLRAVLSGQWGDYGLPPRKSSFVMQALVAQHYIHGAAYPVGGSRCIAETIIPSIERAGGAVLTSAEVEQILIDGGRAVGVRMLDGREVRAPRVISDAGALNTFGRLLPEEVSRALNLMPSLTGRHRSTAHLCLYVGVSKDAQELGLPRTNLWVYPGNDHDANVERFVAARESALPVAYISFPGAKDPSYSRRYPGRSTIEVLTLAPYEWFQPWEDTRWHKRGAEYEQLKANLRDRLLDALYSQVPSVRGHVAIAELSTPLSTRHFTHHLHGEIYGLDHSPARFSARGPRARTDVPGLFLTGQDVATTGVVGAMTGGALCTAAVLGADPSALLSRLFAGRPWARRAASAMG